MNDRPPDTLSRRGLLTALGTGGAALVAGALGLPPEGCKPAPAPTGTPSLLRRRCENLHVAFTPAEKRAMYWKLPLPPPVVMPLRPLPEDLQPPVGAVEEGTAPEWAWLHGGPVSPCGRTGDTSGRADHLYPQPAGAKPSFGYLRAQDFVGQVIPGWRTPLLGYAAQRDDGTFTEPTTPGPLFQVDLGQHLIVRVENRIDPELHLPVSVHLHGGHTPAHSDGHPNFLVHPGDRRDYFYPNGVPLHTRWNGTAWEPVAGQWDLSEVPSTMWYHDHAIDITAHNALMGLAGMYLMTDSLERQLQADRLLPPPERDIGLAIRDVCLQPIRDRAWRSPKVAALGDDVDEARVHFDPFDHDGALGDFVLVNGVFAPTLKLTPDTWRFRILNASLARMYNLHFLAVPRGTAVESAFRVRMEPLPGVEADPVEPPPDPDYDPSFFVPLKHEYLAFDRIGRDSWMFQKAVRQNTAFLSMANRADLVLDLRAAARSLKGPVDVYLVSSLDQNDGRGPGHGDNDLIGERDEPKPEDVKAKEEKEQPADTDPDRGARTAPPTRESIADYLWLLKIEIDGPEGEGTLPLAPCDGVAPTLRPHESLLEKVKAAGLDLTSESLAAAIPTREFNFERGRGAWQINGRFYDKKNANAVPAVWGLERWILRNRSGGWWHPIHIHLESHQQVYAKARGVGEVRFEEAAPLYADLTNPPYTTKDPGPQAPCPPPSGEPVPDTTTWAFDIKHDTAVLGPNTEVHILMQMRTFEGPFVFHCHNLNHEDMMMMFQFDPRLGITPTADEPVRPPWFFACRLHHGETL